MFNYFLIELKEYSNHFILFFIIFNFQNSIEKAEIFDDLREIKITLSYISPFIFQ